MGYSVGACTKSRTILGNVAAQDELAALRIVPCRYFNSAQNASLTVSGNKDTHRDLVDLSAGERGEQLVVERVAGFG
jgi:hypothetical protein